MTYVIHLLVLAIKMALLLMLKKIAFKKIYKLLVYVVGIDKLTETSLVSEDGTTLLQQQSDSTNSQSDHSSETQVRDTEPTAGEDDKVQHH